MDYDAMHLEQTLTKIESLFLANEGRVPDEELQPNEEVLGTLPDELKKVCIAYLVICNDVDFVGGASIRRLFWKKIGELFPEAGAKVATRKFQFGIRKDWQIVVFRYDPPRVVCC